MSSCTSLWLKRVLWRFIQEPGRVRHRRGTVVHKSRSTSVLSACRGTVLSTRPESCPPVELTLFSHGAVLHPLDVLKWFHFCVQNGPTLRNATQRRFKGVSNPYLVRLGPALPRLGLPGPTWGCLGLPGPAWACLGHPGSAWACLGLPLCLVRLVLPGSARSSTKTLAREWLHLYRCVMTPTYLSLSVRRHASRLGR